MEIVETTRAMARPPEPWGGVITIKDEPFPCARYEGDKTLCAGSNPSRQSVVVLWTDDPLDGALAHELAHSVFCRFNHPGGCSEETANSAAAAITAAVRAQRAANAR